jgi:hypothetical protein
MGQNALGNASGLLQPKETRAAMRSHIAGSPAGDGRLSRCSGGDFERRDPISSWVSAVVLDAPSECAPESAISSWWLASWKILLALLNP